MPGLVSRHCRHVVVGLALADSVPRLDRRCVQWHQGSGISGVSARWRAHSARRHRSHNQRPFESTGLTQLARPRICSRVSPLLCMRCRGRASTRKLLQFPSRLTDAWKPPMQEAHGQLHVSVAALLAPANELFAAASKLQAPSFDGRDENSASSSSLSPMIGLARARLSDLGPLCTRASLHQGISRAHHPSGGQLCDSPR
jgi:hypothetical protein